VALVIYATYNIGVYIVSKDLTPDNVLLVWAIYFGYFIYKTGYQLSLANFLNDPSQNDSNLNYVISKIKICYVVDIILSALAHWILNQIEMIHGVKLSTNVFNAQVLIWMRASVMTIY